MDGAEDNIEDRRQALMRILAGLVAMAGLVSGPHPEGSKNGQDPWLAPKAEGEPRRTLQRALRNAVLRLLRPAESAARRLVVALACSFVETFAFRPRGPKEKLLRKRRQFMPVMPPGAEKKPRWLQKTLPLLDAPRRKPGPAWVRQAGVPHIGLGARPTLRPPPSPRDSLDATRLCLRLEALAAVLADPKKQALRFARFQARQAFLRALDRTSRAALRRPLRFGRPPGSVQRSDHDVHDVLDFAHQLALESLRRKPDTS